MKKSLTPQEIESAMSGYPPILTAEQAADILQIQLATLYRHVSEGKYRRATKRGKPLRFWRDKLIISFMGSS